MSRSIRIFSGNLWWGKADPDGLVALIREHQVDVFAAQELGFENAEAIASELPYGCLEPHATYHGMGVALRQPGKYERIPLVYRDARRAVLEPSDWPGLAHAIDLVNVHFQAPARDAPVSLGPGPLAAGRRARAILRREPGGGSRRRGRLQRFAGLAALSKICATAPRRGARSRAARRTASRVDLGADARERAAAFGSTMRSSMGSRSRAFACCRFRGATIRGS